LEAEATLKRAQLESKHLEEKAKERQNQLHLEEQKLNQLRLEKRAKQLRLENE